MCRESEFPPTEELNGSVAIESSLRLFSFQFFLDFLGEVAPGDHSYKKHVRKVGITALPILPSILLLE